MSLNMNWIIENELAIGPYPTQQEIARLHKEGFRVIVRLTEEAHATYEIPDEWLEALHFPIADFGLPTVEQAALWVRNMHFYKDAGQKVYMHCRAGYGRAGTMAGLYLVSLGNHPERAIRMVRSRRPGTIETDAQQKMILWSEEWMKALTMKEDMQWFKARKMIEVLRKKCPWDKIQTHETLIESLMDESYEVVEAIRKKDPDQLKDELGDLLIQPLIQSHIASEKGSFSITDALTVMLEKLIRRHPHVFGGSVQHHSKGVVHQWADIKKTEVKEPECYPSPLREMMDISHEASHEGFDWEKVEDVLEKIVEEVDEAGNALKEGDHRMVENELGDLVFAVFNAIRFLHLDPVKVMERGRRKFEIRYRTAMKMIKEDGLIPCKMSPMELDTYWKKAKKMMENE